MKQDTPRKQWEDGVSLGSAWWVYADLEKKRRFRELQQTASHAHPAPHLGFRHTLEDEVIGRLSSGELQAFGVEYGSTGEPIAISRNYFGMGTEIDFDNDTVTALGRKFGQVKVQGNREQIIESLQEMPTTDLREVLAGLQLPPVPDFHDDPSVIPDTETPPDPPRSEVVPQDKVPPGRPTKRAEIERAIDDLVLSGVNLANMPRPTAYKAVKNRAAELGSNTKIGFSNPVIQRALQDRFGRRR